MACTPLGTPTVSLFDNSSQGTWLNATETKGGRTVTHTSSGVTISAPNGTLNFPEPGGQVVRHKFFGTDNFLAILTSETTNPGNQAMSIVDFTGPSLTSTNVMFISAIGLPFLQPSLGNGVVCLIGAPTPSGTGGLAILRSDTGAVILGGPPPFTPVNQVIGEVVAGSPLKVQIKDGGAIKAGPVELPAGEVKLTPSNPTTFSTVKLGGCAAPTSTKQFTLKNDGDDCLSIDGVGSVAPYSVTAQSQSFPAKLAKNESMTVTVTFAPAAAGSFNNVSLPITRTPANGASSIVCSGQAQTAQPAFTVTANPLDYGHKLVGTPVNGTFTVKNTGDVPIAFSVSAGSGVFDWPAFAGTLTCGQSQVVPVTFTPAVEGPVSSVVTVVGTPGGTKTITLLGDGCIPNAVISVPPAPFPAFGEVRQGYRMPRFITVTNTGDDTLTFTASISGPDAALFGLMKASQSITDVQASRSYIVHPEEHCGGGQTGDGKEEVVVVFHANDTPPKTATATLTIDSHNASNGPASFTLPLTASVIAGNVVDAVAVIDTSGSMAQAVQGGGNKMGAAMQAGRLFASLIPPDLGNRIAGTRFSTDASTFLGIGEVTAGNQQSKVDAIKDPPLTPNGWTAIAAGVMTGIPEFAVPRTGPVPALLTKSVVVLTDGMDNTAFKNPADNKFYSVLGGMARDPGNPAVMIATLPFVPPADVKIYAVGLGTGQDIDASQLAQLSSGSGGNWFAVDPTQPATAYQLMKYYTQIYMDLFDASTISDPKDLVYPGNKNVYEFDILNGDVNAMIVIYDLGGLRLPFWLESPAGEIVDGGFVPPGFQMRSGFTETSRFLDFVMPAKEPQRYAGRWKLIVMHDGKVCRGNPPRKPKSIGFAGADCGEYKAPVEFGYAIGVGSNFRLQAYVTGAPVSVGQPIRLTGMPTEAGLPVTGCTVTVDAVAPDGQAWTNIVLADDGAHDDGDADDGEYARLFTHTAVAGTYSFTFRASGFTRDGEPVHREVMRSKYVEGTIKQPPVTGDPGGRGGVSDACCKKIIALLERMLEAKQK
ncbi:MAG: choice-of-anchor D domain-containing protein [Gemmatimonadaceae bacterium]|nr:choice-of-anchor D domain-containing protein [Gemmatimonadaceae bacterium]